MRAEGGDHVRKRICLLLLPLNPKEFQPQESDLRVLEVREVASNENYIRFFKSQNYIWEAPRMTKSCIRNGARV